jgi:ribosome-interacting GTPase 1
LHIEPEQFNLYVRADLILVVVDLQDDPLQQLEDTVDILAEHRIVPAHLAHRYGDLVRALPKPFLVVVNKCDDQSLDGDFAALCELLQDDWSLVPVSAASGRNLEQLKQTVFEWLDIIRVYAKPPGREPDFTAPYVLSQGSTVEDFAGQVHKDFTENLKSARVWGKGVFDGQLVARDHVLHDGDVVELRI